MTPLDDELRRTLSSRAAALAPPSNPLAGVEGRASRLRRRRVVASAAGTAAVVAAVALAVPALVPDRDEAHPPRFATTTPAPADPSTWAYRGEAIPAATLDTYSRAWQTRHAGSTMTPLFGQVYGPSATQELVFVAQGPQGARFGVVQSGGAITCPVPNPCPTPGVSSPEFVADAPLGSLHELAFLLPGDEVARVLVVAAPDSQAITYRDASTATPAALTALAPGVATGPAAAVRPGPLVSVIRADGSIDELAPYDVNRVPANLLRWPLRGTDAVSPSTLDLRTQFAKAFGRNDVDSTSYSPLFVGQTDGGVRYTMGQAWFADENTAYTVSYATGGSSGPVFFLGPVTPAAPWGLAFLFGNLPGRSTDLLVVVPRPTTGQVAYAPGASGAFQPITGQDQLAGVVLVDRAKNETTDRLEVFDGNGNLDQPTYRGPVAPLLCGLKGCG